MILLGVSSYPCPIHVSRVDKVCQLTGEVDRERNVPTLSRTASRFGLAGTDLGASFEYRGKLVFLFGDTWPVGPNTSDRPVDGDAIAFCDAREPGQGLKLDFLTASDGQYKAVQIPGVSLKGFEVPTGGFSVGSHLYGIYTTDHSHVAEGEVMGRSVLARSDDEGRTWHKVYDLSTGHFINVAPFISGGYVWLCASGREYRRSSPYLARVPIGHVEDHDAVRFWTGDSWSANEADSRPLFVHPQIGEISFAWCRELGKWLMTYNSGTPRGILLRTADHPTGPWSEPTVLFDPKAGYGKFIHIASGADRVNDPGRERDFGGEYAPYMIPKFFKKTGDGARIYFTMSTWNPYAVVLMSADLGK